MQDLTSPLTAKEESRLDHLLSTAGGRDFDGVLGVLHAVAVAPGLIPPSSWVPTILTHTASLERDDVEEIMGLLMRLYNYVLEGLSKGDAMIPPVDEPEACRSFAAGYTDGALLDSSWVEDDDRWTFVSGMAYLAGRKDIVDPRNLKELEEDPDAEKAIREEMPGVVRATHETFTEARRQDAEMNRPAPRRAGPRVGRNEPCPCGSGKKYKRCCLLAAN